MSTMYSMHNQLCSIGSSRALGQTFALSNVTSSVRTSYSQNMHPIHFVVMFFVTFCIVNARVKDSCDNVKAPFNVFRKKRHLTFPEGTNVVLTISLVKAIMVHAPSGWNIAIEIDVLFPVLSPEKTNAFFRKKFHHRQKREFWETIQRSLDSYNFNGRSCIYRSICECRTHLAPPGKSLVHDILRAIFSFRPIFLGESLSSPEIRQVFNFKHQHVPQRGAPLHEEGFKEEVNETYNELLEPNVCERIHDCPISLLESILALNKMKR